MSYNARNARKYEAQRRLMNEIVERITEAQAKGLTKPHDIALGVSSLLRHRYVLRRRKIGHHTIGG